MDEDSKILQDNLFQATQPGLPDSKALLLPPKRMQENRWPNVAAESI